jgi:hypothetical protein
MHFPDEHAEQFIPLLRQHWETHHQPRNFTWVRVLPGRDRVRLVDLDFGPSWEAAAPRVVR